MEKYRFIKRVIKKDLYRVLRYKYPLSFQRIIRRVQQHDVVIFQETIDLLEKYDLLISTLKNDEEPTHLELPYFTPEQDRALNNLINSLRYPRSILSEQAYLDFLTFRKISQYLDLSPQLNFSTQVVTDLNNYFGQGLPRLCMDNYSPEIVEYHRREQDLFLAFLERLKPKVMADPFIVDGQFDLGLYEEQYKEKFLKALDEHKQLYVFCFDVTIYRLQQQVGDDYKKLFLNYKDQIEKVVQKVSGLSTLIHCLYRLEPSQRFGLNLHFVLTLKETKYFSEATFILNLKRQLNDIFFSLMDNYIICNWNDVVRKHLNKKAVGLIRKHDEAEVNESWYWIFSSFFALEQIIRFNLDPSFSNADVKDGPLALPQPSLLLLSNSTSLYDQVKFKDLNEKDATIFTHRTHLVASVQQYLAYAELIYSEYSYLSTNEEEYLFLGGVLGKIEMFCETLKAVKPELFIIPNKAVLGVFSSDEYSKMSTRLGRMWLDIFKSLSDKVELIRLLLKVNFRSQNVLSFMNFLKENLEELQGFHNHQLNESMMLKLNHKLSLLKNELGNHKLLTSIKVLDNRLKDLTKYARYLLAKDVYVLRIQIEFTNQNKSLSKADQSPILTEFLRVGQSAQPLSWLRGYLLRWDQYDCTQRQSRQTYADLTLFFEYQAKLQNVNLTEMLKQYLTKFIARYNEKKKLSNTANEIDCNKIICNVFSQKTELRQEVLKIETIDRELRKIFMKSYLPYFCFLDLFIVWMEMKSGKKIKRFTSGQKPKSKKISTPKGGEYL